MSEINLPLQRLLSFVEEKGGKAKVARLMGKAPQKFSNLIAKNARPSVDSLEEFAQHFPDIDLNYIIKGVPTVEKSLMRDLEEKVKMYEEMMKRVLSPKSEAVTTPPRIADLEGASEMLTDSVFSTIAGSRFGSQPFAL